MRSSMHASLLNYTPVCSRSGGVPLPLILFDVIWCVCVCVQVRDLRPQGGQISQFEDQRAAEGDGAAAVGRPAAGRARVLRAGRGLEHPRGEGGAGAPA